MIFRTEWRIGRRGREKGLIGTQPGFFTEQVVLTKRSFIVKKY